MGLSFYGQPSKGKDKNWETFADLALAPLASRTTDSMAISFFIYPPPKPQGGGCLGSVLTVFDAIIFKVMSRQVIAPKNKPLITKYAEQSSLEVQRANMADTIAAIPKIIVLYLSITKHSLHLFGYLCLQYFQSTPKNF